LPEEYAGIANVHLDAVEHGDSIVFLHSVREGPANQSYGLQVAALAGVPKSIIERARMRLHELENSAHHHSEQETSQLSLFGSSPAVSSTPAPSEETKLEQELKQIDPDELTPRQALDALYQLKALQE